jgi:hypothetical protein
MPATAKQPSSQLQKLHKYFGDKKDKFHKTHGETSKWLKTQAIDLSELRQNSKQFLAAASMAGSLVVNQPVDAIVADQIKGIESKQKDETLSELSGEEHQAIIDKMKNYVNGPAGHLEAQEEVYLEQQLSDILGFEVTAELDNHRLNHSIGIMGGEQHLFRFPGDTLDQHDAFQEAGIAPNRGAFGWFTENGVLTDKAIQNEKYYFAVQTLYLADWNSNHRELKPWYKFRKMVVINPADQIAVVGVVGDAGPAQWVKKQYGGSPEIIREGKIWSKANRGRVILFFVDDPDDTIPLGPIEFGKDFNQTIATTE